jgi:hypothetical protein
MVLMPDENFEGDFLEVQENNHGITNAASAGSLLIRSQERYETDENTLSTYRAFKNNYI